MKTIVQLENISVSLDNKLILKDINLMIKEGHFVAIIGPNGAGKTTLLKVITGLIKPTAGKVKLFGEEKFRQYQLIGYVPQLKKVDWNFPITVFDAVLMGRYSNMGFFRKPSAEDKTIVRQCLEKVQLAEYENYQICQLSGGQQQRVFIARAISSKPGLLILDEPTTGIDQSSRDFFYTMIETLKKDFNLTILYVTHELEVIPRLADEVVCLNRTVHIHGKPEAMLADEHFKTFYGAESEWIYHGDIPHRVLKKHPEK